MGDYFQNGPWLAEVKQILSNPIGRSNHNEAHGKVVTKLNLRNSACAVLEWRSGYRLGPLYTRANAAQA